MISITKGAIPAVLAANAAAWTANLIGKLNNGPPPTKTDKGRYNHEEIKAALLQETRGKCAYCESKLRHVTYGDIEHVVPKSTDPNLWFEWQNLTIACDVCNTNKGSHDGLIDPYTVDPSVHLWVIGEFVWPAPGSDLGIVAERTLGLNRADLLDRRRDRLKDLIALLGVIARVQDPQAKKVLQGDFLQEIESDKEYAALAREVHRRAQAEGTLP